MKLTSETVELPKANQLGELAIFHAQKDLKIMLLKKVDQFKRMRQEKFSTIGTIVAAQVEKWNDVPAGQRIDHFQFGRRITAFQAAVDWIEDIDTIGNPIESWWLVVSIWLALAKYGVVNLIASEEEYVPNEPNILCTY